MPVRSIPCSHRSITGRLPGLHPGQSVEHESLLERDCVLLFQGNPAVLSVESQPVRIRFSAPGKKGRTRVRSHIPDFLVRFRRGSGRAPLLVEVKYHEELRMKHAEYLPRVCAARRYARQQGWNYRVYTDRIIRASDHLLLNLKFLQAYRHEKRDTSASKQILFMLTLLRCASVRVLLEQCAGADREKRARFVGCLWRLIATHEVQANLRAAPLTLETPVYLAASPQGASASTRSAARSNQK